MRASIISLLALSTVALAQDLSSLPTCAQSAALTAAGSSGCSLSDAECFCKNAGFISSLKTAISSTCTGDDQQTACTFANSACSTYGVTIPCSTATATSSAAAPTATTSTSSMPTDTGSATVDAAMASGTDTSSSMSSSMSMTSTTSSMADGTTGSAMTDSTMTSSMSMTTSMTMTSSMSMTTSTTVWSNGTTTCTWSCGNTTHAATSMASHTSSGPTSLYTGAASSAAGHSEIGVIGAVAAVAFLFAFS